MDSHSSTPSLRASDYALLALLCAALFGFSLVQPRVFTTHETTHCLNVREMFQSGDYLVPTYGGRPWLERPPAPHWLTGCGAAIAGDFHSEWPMRLGSIFIATLAVLVFAWSVGGCFGRAIGVMSGAIFATMREFAAYAIAPEADIFLAATVTICGALFLRLQFTSTDARARFFGARSGTMLLFFVLLGLTNWMKGPLFGMIFVLLPMAGCFLWSRDRLGIRRFGWFWGWLALLTIAAAWPIGACLRFPDVVELWAVDYGVRWQSGYIGEPFWYYLVNQPWNLFPWTIPALAGLVVTWSAVRGNQLPALRFIWCWALLPVAFFSLFKGKHHHYMLSCLAPAAVLGSFGAGALWDWIRRWPAPWRGPWFAVAAIALPGTVLVILFGQRIPGPDWIRLSLAAVWPFAALLLWWIAAHPNGRVAFAGTCLIVVVASCLAYSHRARFMDSYEADRVFIAEVKERVAADRPLLVVNDEHPLNSSWLLYYLGEHSRLLHNHTFLRDDRINAPIAYVVCRKKDEAALADYGAVRQLAQSAHARGETSAGDRWTLFEVRFYPHLARMPGDVRVSPLQATGRRPGPFLGAEVAGRR